jgi:hypothetical protein
MNLTNNCFLLSQGNPKSDPDDEDKFREESTFDQKRRTVGSPKVSNPEFVMDLDKRMKVSVSPTFMR